MRQSTLSYQFVLLVRLHRVERANAISAAPRSGDAWRTMACRCAVAARFGVESSKSKQPNSKRQIERVSDGKRVAAENRQGRRRARAVDVEDRGTGDQRHDVCRLGASGAGAVAQS